LAGFTLLVAIALMITIGVVPSILADTSSGVNAASGGRFPGIAVVFDLLAAARLARRTAAFLARLMGLSYCGLGVLASGRVPVTSVIADRSRLSK
jgi:hypothetical protein